MKSKIIIFFLFAFFFVTNIGCSHNLGENLRDKHVIPDVPVYAQIDLSVGGEGNNWIGQPRYFNTSSTGKSLGYNGQGIIIYTNNNTDFKCYDATCTNCSGLTSYMTQKDLQGDFSQCPVCGVRFFLLYGYPDGTEKKIYPLKEYPIVKSGNKLIVRYK